MVKNVRKQLEEWLNEQGNIEYKELYRFLHSISGTAMTIGFNQAGEVAQSLISQLEGDDEREWTKEDLQEFLLPLMSIFYDKEYSLLTKSVNKLKN